MNINLNLKIMKKFTILLMFVACATFIFAQSTDKNPTRASLRFSEGTAFSNTETIENSTQTGTKAGTWDRNFEGGVDWYFDNLSPSSTIQWQVGRAEEFVLTRGGAWFKSWSSVVDLNGVRNSMFPNGNNRSAFIDIIGENSDPAIGGSGHSFVHAAIRFNSIDLRDFVAPKITFSQKIMLLNREKTYLEWAEDVNFTQNLHTIDMHPGLLGNDWGPNSNQAILSGAAGKVIYLRFRIKSNESLDDADHGYWWIIDNIEINDAPDYDVSLEDYRVNFFEMADYHDPVWLSQSLDNLGYHYSNHIGQFPKSFAANGDLKIGFSGAIKNYGALDVTPKLNVKIIKDGGDIANPIWESTITATRPTPSSQLLDTLDIWGDLDLGDQAWTVPANIEVGKYWAKFEALIEGQENNDANPNNNLGEAFFYVTNDTYGLDARNITSTAAAYNSYGNAGRNDTYRIDYSFFTDETVTAIEFFLGANSTIGKELIFEFNRLNQTVDPAIYETVTSVVYEVVASDLGSWVNITIPTPIPVTTVQGFGRIRLLVTFNNVNPDANENLTIGVDNANKYSWGKLGAGLAGVFYYGTNEGLGIRLRTGSVDEIPPYVVKTTPRNGQSGINVEDALLVEFNDIITATDLSNIYIQKYADGTILPNVTATIQGKIITITHDRLEELTTYEVFIPNGTIVNYNEGYTFWFKTAGPVSTPTFDLSNEVSIYPNPTNGDLNIANVKGATIEVLNLMGQVVERIDNADELNTINMSKHSNGSYFVKVVIEGNVSVSKINLTK